MMKIEMNFKKLFESTRNLGCFTVMIAVEREIEKIFVHFLRFGCQI